MYYIFDGSFDGLLTSVFESFERKEFDITPMLQGDFQMDAFALHRKIKSDENKAKRVFAGLIKQVGGAVAMDFFRVFLSEDRKAWKSISQILVALFQGKNNILENYGNSDALYFSKTLKKVSRERHRMKAFVRFNKSSDGLFVSMVEPDFNVLPLISDFFKKRYADQRWLIYDVKRKYGILYDTVSVSEVRLSAINKDNLSINMAISLDEQDEYFQQLWKTYFTSTNIEARRNMKLHLQHVPKRYWKYLSEKQ